jgi:hypothetical protein
VGCPSEKQLFLRLGELGNLVSVIVEVWRKFLLSKEADGEMSVVLSLLSGGGAVGNSLLWCSRV